MNKKKPPAKKKRDTSNWKPARILGRVDEETWVKLQAAARRDGETFTKWALDHLLKAAGKEVSDGP
jgi:hypothetical protein